MTLCTAIAYPNHRSIPLSAVGDFVRLIEQSGVIDQFWAWDELAGWSPEGFPPRDGGDPGDPHSTHDPFIQCAFAAATSRKIGVRMTTDAARARPAELTRALLSLTSATEGAVTIALGAGEARHIRPFGYAPGEGLARLEDILRLARRLLTEDQPFEFEGKHWHFGRAYIGRERPRKPEFWALGGGPKLLDIASRHADGLEVSVPSAVTSLKSFKALVVEMRDRLRKADRDPAGFGFGVWLTMGLHEDPAVIAHAKKTPSLAWFSASYGRFNQADWAAEGLQSVFPEKWHYSRNYLPFEMSGDEAAAIAARVPPAMVENAAFWGTPQQAAAWGRQFVEAGASFVGIIDVMPLAVGPEGAQASMMRSVEVARLLKSP